MDNEKSKKSKKTKIHDPTQVHPWSEENAKTVSIKPKKRERHENIFPNLSFASKNQMILRNSLRKNKNTRIKSMKVNRAVDPDRPTARLEFSSAPHLKYGIFPTVQSAVFKRNIQGMSTNTSRAPTRNEKMDKKGPKKSLPPREETTLLFRNEEATRVRHLSVSTGTHIDIKPRGRTS